TLICRHPVHNRTTTFGYQVPGQVTNLSMKKKDSTNLLFVVVSLTRHPDTEFLSWQTVHS
ncbi:25817_t:CDS:1, partial [Gigaspora rosea]